jgi:hypothetical protein
MKPLNLRIIVKTLLFAACVLYLALAQRPISAQGEEEIASAADGKNTFEFVAVIEQNALDLSSYGYITHVSGLTDEQLFSDPSFLKWYAPTAYLTFTTTAKLNTRYTLENIIDTDSTGTFTLYFNEKPQADFKDAKSFAKGKPIAVYAVRFQHILTVTQPDTGIVSGVGELRQQDSTPFTLNGKTYRFGHTGLLERMTSSGSGKRTESILPKSHFVEAGNAFVVGK